MGLLTGAQFLVEIKAAFGNREDITDARYLQFLNLAQLYIARLQDWEEFERLSTAATNFTGDLGVDRYLSIPTNTRKFWSLVLEDGTNSRRLAYVNPIAWDKKITFPENDSTDRPRFYTRYRGTIELWRIPNAAYTIRARHTVWPTALADDAVVSEFDMKDDVILDLGIAFGYKYHVGNTDKAAKFFRYFQNALQAALSQEEDHKGDDIKPDFEIGLEEISGNLWANPFIRGL